MDHPSGSGKVAVTDHYLCVCIDDSHDEACKAAVRAACTVGHIPASECRKSFKDNNHEDITDSILFLVQNGAHCANTPNFAETESAASTKKITATTPPKILFTDPKTCLRDPCSGAPPSLLRPRQIKSLQPLMRMRLWIRRRLLRTMPKRLLRLSSVPAEAGMLADVLARAAATLAL